MPFSVRVVGASRSAGGPSNTATITVACEHGHPFRKGDKVNLYGLVQQSGTVGFSDGNPYTVTGINAGRSLSKIGGENSVTGATVLYVDVACPNGYAATDAVTRLGISAGTVIGNSLKVFQITTSSPHGLSAGGRGWLFGLEKVSGLSTQDLYYINRDSLPYTIISGSVIEFTSRAVSSFAGVNWTSGSVVVGVSAGVVSSADSINPSSGVAGASGFNPTWTSVRRQMLENDAVSATLQMIANFTAGDFAIQRLCYPYDLSKIKTTRVPTRINISQPPASWRSVLDAIIEAYSGGDAKKRRYWIDPDGIFNYDILDDSKPATANAPYKIIVSGAGNPNSTTNPTVAPFSLSLGVDHDTTKRALFSTANNTGQPISDFVRYDSADALGTAATRSGAPTFDDLVEYPTGTTAQLISRQTGARSFFLERALPAQSGQFTLRGAGTASWNNLGFTSGFATVSSPTSVTLPLFAGYSRAGTNREVSAYDFANIAVGMQAVITGFSTAWFADGDWNGTFTITDFGRTRLTAWDTGLPFSYSGTFSLPLAVGPFYAINTGYAQAVISGLFVRTGTAPNQIVTVTLPLRHNLRSNATVTVSGLTGTAGTSMNGTVTATVIDEYTFTYPSTGTNGTASGSAALSSLTQIPNWTPGQWVDITAPDFGLSGLYRVEQVDWRLEPGSFQQIVTITFNRRNKKLLTRILQERKR